MSNYKRQHNYFETLKPENQVAIRIFLNEQTSFEIDLVELQLILDAAFEGVLTTPEMEVFLDDSQTIQIGPVKLRGINSADWCEMVYPYDATS